MNANRVGQAFGFLYPGEIALLAELTKQLPDNPVVVNIGAGAGTSGLTFFEARPDVTVITVDIQNDSSPFGSLEGERNAFRDSGYYSALGFRWQQMHGDSIRVGMDYKGLSINLLFVDGNHSYEGCRGDVLAWNTHLIVPKLIAIHDYKKTENDPTENGRKYPYPGVDRAVNELLTQGWKMVRHQDTLAVITRG